MSFLCLSFHDIRYEENFRFKINPSHPQPIRAFLHPFSSPQSSSRTILRLFSTINQKINTKEIWKLFLSVLKQDKEDESVLWCWVNVNKQNINMYSFTDWSFGSDSRQVSTSCIGLKCFYSFHSEWWVNISYRPHMTIMVRFQWNHNSNRSLTNLSLT